MVLHTIRTLLNGMQVETSLPAAGRLTWMRQGAQKRDILHLLFATPTKRGKGIEVIEDLIPLHNVQVSARRAGKPSKATLAPQGTEVPFTYADGRVTLTVEKVECHQMVVFSD